MYSKLLLMFIGGIFSVALGGITLRRRDIVDTLLFENGLDRGNWGQVDTCPEGTIVDAFEFKSEDIGHIDDTAGNGVKIYCKDTATGQQSYYTSFEGKSGKWQGIRQCPNKLQFIGMRIEALEYQGAFGDDMGVTDVQLICEDNTVLDGLEEPYRVKDVSHQDKGSNGIIKPAGDHLSSFKSLLYKDAGVWSDWKYCSPGHYICGLQTRIEPTHITDDDAGLCDILMFCC